MLFYFIFIMKSSSTDSGNKKLQKQSFAVVLHNRFFKNFANVIGKHLCCSLFKKGLQDRCFFVNFCEFFCFFVKFLTTIFIQNASGGCFWNFFFLFCFCFNFRSQGVFRIPSGIWDGIFLRKKLTAATR